MVYSEWEEGMFRYFVVDDIVLYMRVFVYYYLYFYMAMHTTLYMA